MPSSFSKPLNSTFCISLGIPCKHAISSFRSPTVDSTDRTMSVLACPYCSLNVTSSPLPYPSPSITTVEHSLKGGEKKLWLPSAPSVVDCFLDCRRRLPNLKKIPHHSDFWVQSCDPPVDKKSSLVVGWGRLLAFCYSTDLGGLLDALTRCHLECGCHSQSSVEISPQNSEDFVSCLIKIRSREAWLVLQLKSPVLSWNTELA